MSDALIYIARLVDRKFRDAYLYAFRASSFDEAVNLACEEATRCDLEVGHLERCANPHGVVIDADRTDEWGFAVRPRPKAPTHQPTRQGGLGSATRPRQTKQLVGAASGRGRRW
jgi:hypothetical protein